MPGQTQTRSREQPVGDRDIMSSTPPTWRVPLIIALCMGVLLSASWAGWIEISIQPRLADPNRPEPEIKFGDDFDLIQNMKSFFTSVRGEVFIVIVVIVFIGSFVIHTISWALFKALMDKELYAKLSVRDAWFLGQK